MKLSRVPALALAGALACDTLLTMGSTTQGQSPVVHGVGLLSLLQVGPAVRPSTCMAAGSAVAPTCPRRASALPSRTRLVLVSTPCARRRPSKRGAFTHSRRYKPQTTVPCPAALNMHYGHTRTAPPNPIAELVVEADRRYRRSRYNTSGLRSSVANHAAHLSPHHQSKPERREGAPTLNNLNHKTIVTDLLHGVPPLDACPRDSRFGVCDSGWGSLGPLEARIWNREPRIWSLSRVAAEGRVGFRSVALLSLIALALCSNSVRTAESEEDALRKYASAIASLAKIRFDATKKTYEQGGPFQSWTWMDSEDIEFVSADGAWRFRLRQRGNTWYGGKISSGAVDVEFARNERGDIYEIQRQTRQHNKPEPRSRRMTP